MGLGFFFLWVPQDIYVCSAVCLSLLFSGVVAFKPLYWEVPTIEKGMDFFMLNLSLWVGGSPSCASFPSPYINVFCKGYQLYLLFSRPSSEKLSQSVIDGISVLGGQYHGMLNFYNSSLISSFYINVTPLCRLKPAAQTPFPFLLVKIFFQGSCVAFTQGGEEGFHLFITELEKLHMGFLHCICLFIVE